MKASAPTILYQLKLYTNQSSRHALRATLLYTRRAWRLPCPAPLCKGSCHEVTEGLILAGKTVASIPPPCFTWSPSLNATHQRRQDGSCHEVTEGLSTFSCYIALQFWNNDTPFHCCFKRQTMHRTQNLLQKNHLSAYLCTPSGDFFCLKFSKKTYRPWNRVWGFPPRMSIFRRDRIRGNFIKPKGFHLSQSLIGMEYLCRLNRTEFLYRINLL